MGRRSKSPTEKRLTGAGKRKAQATPAAAAGLGDFRPPAWLVDQRALDVWGRIVPELRRLNIMIASDADTFARYCTYFGEWIEASATIRTEGSTVMVKMTNSEERMPRLHPAVRVRDIAERNLLDFEDRFGGSPLARYRLIAQQAAHPGAFGDLFNRLDPAGAAVPAPAAATPIGVLRQTQH